MPKKVGIMKMETQHTLFKHWKKHGKTHSLLILWPVMTHIAFLKKEDLKSEALDSHLKRLNSNLFFLCKGILQLETDVSQHGNVCLNLLTAWN